MSLIHRLHGAQCTPLRQQLRRTDGVRGVFTLKPLMRGELILSLPLRYCYITHLSGSSGRGASSQSPRWESADEGSRQLRRWNRGVALLPEVWTWLQRYSSDASTDRVSLTSSISAETSVSEHFGEAAAAAPSVVSLTLSPVEAALATAIALRYFFTRALHLTPATRAAQLIGPPPNALADVFVDNLPLELYMQMGVEAVYGDAAAGEAHLCLEQLSHNLRDAILTHANAAEYRFLDEFPSLFDNLLLVCLYVVRARVLTMPLLGAPPHGKEETQVSVFAPLLDAMNHAPVLPSAAVVVALQRQRVVMRATRDVRRGEEITLNYRAAGALPGAAFAAATAAGALSGYEMPMEEDWAPRYLMSEEKWS